MRFGASEIRVSKNCMILRRNLENYQQIADVQEMVYVSRFVTVHVVILVILAKLVFGENNVIQ